MRDKIILDKYYTPVELSQKLINKTYEIIGRDNISEIIEPSAGNGSFSLLIDNCIAYDILPDHKDIIKQDFLELKLDYKPNRLIIGNPPFGERMNLALQFYNKSVQLGDYIAFILPVSQFNNNNALYKFDLIYSENLGEITFSEYRKVKCCFNIYKRNPNGLNNKPKFKLNDITIYRKEKNNNYDNLPYDIRMCYWGNSCAGKILKKNEHYAGEYKIVINNEYLKSDIIKFFNTVNWDKEIEYTTMKRIKQYHIYKIIKKYIPNIN